ncbi:PIN domain-containing protein [Candidatus Gottesmanbacteria bacterium]|nr:PIN domain-containing protein [Candidatus Gottesmanbacteria bacterium]
MKVLLDTSVIIDFLRLKDKSKSALYAITQKEFSLSVSIITHTELYAGTSVWSNSIALRELETIFSGIDLIALTEKISQEAGKIKALYKIDLIDAIIAATAIGNDMTLVTLNTKHFKKIPHLRIAEVDNLS